jgi:hypothetical protein
MQHILSIPTRHGEEDLPAWHFDTKGIFLVKSAYHVLEDNRDSVAGYPSHARIARILTCGFMGQLAWDAL